MVGIVEVSKLAHKDSTSEVDTWECVDIRAVADVPRPVTLDEIKADPKLKDMVLVNNSRLSVQPVSEAEFRAHLQAGRRQALILDRARFIRANTTVMTPPLVPEVKLHLAHEAVPLWQKTEEELGEMGLPPPFWAFAWAGGQALARHVLDNPALVRGKRVVDLASGSGLVGLAAMKAGAASVLAADIDGFSLEAIRLNAALNGMEMEVTGDDLLAAPAPDCDVILVGDLFYEKDARGARLLLARGGRGAGHPRRSSAIPAAATCRATGAPEARRIPRRGHARPRGCRDQNDFCLAAEPVLLR